MQLWFWREETELAVVLLIWRTVQMTECLDGLAAWLTKSLTCCLIVTTNAVWIWQCVRSHWWMNGQISWLWQMEECGSVLSSPLSVFSKGGNGETEAQTQASLSALKGARGLVEKGHVDRQRAQEGGRLAFMKQNEPCNASVTHWTLRSSGMETLQEGATENTASPRSPEKKWHSCGWWESLTSLAHKDGFTAQIHCCGDLLFGSFVKGFHELNAWS